MYIVTGGAGFIGSAMVWKLNRMGIDDIIVVDNLATTEKWKNLVNLRYADYIHRDGFMDMVLHGDLPWEVDAIVHMGACSSTTERDADFLMENNFRYSRMLCTLAMQTGARFVNASSAATYGDGTLGFSDDDALMPRLKPLNMYGYSKQLFDLWARREGLLDSIASLKFFNVYGPNEYHKDDMRSVICKSFHNVNNAGRITLFRSNHPDYADGGQMRDFVYVKDCVEVMWWLLQHPEVGGVFNVGTGTSRTWNDLARAVFASMDREPVIEYMDMPVHLAGKYQNYTQASMDKLRRAGCDVPFRSLEDGVDDYVRGYLATDDPYLSPEA
ncbi:ADP-glyceromanno-heptose 6-epimerase [Nitratidesulfovibrio liaohensis]|uniref:ADP-glyceromanno-heptose 6-epimerase n=1 Tax=Nitratidesulfovibrio liaohensis TaxID=2604158 RepID=UPI001420C29A|nr:ADP-glyceromanno-heptose 6-epimerase [Nitratidesulfovibrio liaohensis]NHZ45220.1 ADP-glyceromanno-heptose 6-epimerase [Nitratidesulfovibrio liaohensis]